MRRCCVWLSISLVLVWVSAGLCAKTRDDVRDRKYHNARLATLQGDRHDGSPRPRPFLGRLFPFLKDHYTGMVTYLVDARPMEEPPRETAFHPRHVPPPAPVGSSAQSTPSQSSGGLPDMMPKMFPASLFSGVRGSEVASFVRESSSSSQDSKHMFDTVLSQQDRTRSSLERLNQGDLSPVHRFIYTPPASLTPGSKKRSMRSSTSLPREGPSSAGNLADIASEGLGKRSSGSQVSHHEAFQVGDLPGSPFNRFPRGSVSPSPISPRRISPLQAPSAFGSARSLPLSDRSDHRSQFHSPHASPLAPPQISPFKSIQSFLGPVSASLAGLRNPEDSPLGTVDHASLGTADHASLSSAHSSSRRSPRFHSAEFDQFRPASTSRARSGQSSSGSSRIRGTVVGSDYTGRASSGARSFVSADEASRPQAVSDDKLTSLRRSLSLPAYAFTDLHSGHAMGNTPPPDGPTPPGMPLLQSQSSPQGSHGARQGLQTSSRTPERGPSGFETPERSWRSSSTES